jgi:hypothetical protein
MYSLVAIVGRRVPTAEDGGAVIFSTHGQTRRVLCGRYKFSTTWRELILFLSLSSM